MIAVTLISWALPVVIVAYLVAIVSFVSMMRREHQEYWRSIGTPRLWDPNGQVAVLKKIFLPRSLPAEISSRHGPWLTTIRVLGALGLVLFLAVFLMIWLGVFDPARAPGS